MGAYVTWDNHAKTLAVKAIDFGQHRSELQLEEKRAINSRSPSLSIERTNYHQVPMLFRLEEKDKQWIQIRETIA